MVRLFILLKRKGSKRFLGAVPTKPTATRSSLKKQIRRNLKPGLVAKIVNQAQLNRIILRQRPKSARLRLARRKLRKSKRKSRRVKRRIRRR